MVEFNGWDMPVEYPASIGCGIISEHNAVRTGVGIFDVSHMGDIRLAGGEAIAAVQHISMNDASRLAIGQAQYSALLYPQGTFVDDVIVHRFGEDEYLLVINAGTREKDFAWVRDNTREFDCAVENLSDDFTQIAIQGPKGVNLLQKLTNADLSGVKFYWVTHGTVCGLPNTLIARTGYTGEDGFEIYVPSDEETSTRVWNEVLGAGREFGARDYPARHGRAESYAAHPRRRNLHPQRHSGSLGLPHRSGDGPQRDPRLRKSRSLWAGKGWNGLKARG